MVAWGSTAIHGGVEEHPWFTTLTHATELENAVMVVKNGSIKAHPEREKGQALLDKPVEVVWLSPNDWQLYEGNVYGCIAFDFNWTQLVEDYGGKIYGLEVLNSRMATSRVLFSNTDLQHYFGDRYDPTADDVPWKTHQGRHYIRRHCVLQVAVDAPSLSLYDLEGIRFIDQRQGRSGRRLHADVAARCFLARAVGEQLPSIKGFCGINQATNQPYDPLLWACQQTWRHVWRRYENADLHGPVEAGHEGAFPLARTFLDRSSRLPALAPYPDTLMKDAEQLAALFHSRNDLLLGVRQAIGRWAGIAELNSLNGEDWPLP